MSKRAKYEHQAKIVDNELARIWDDILEHSQIDNWREVIRPHEKSCGLGYADVTIAIETKSGAVVPIKLPGIYVKTLNGHPQLDMPSDEVAAKNEGEKPSYFPHYNPMSAAFREALTYFIFADVEVQGTLQRAVEMTQGQPESTPAAAPAPAATPGTAYVPKAGNPFFKQAGS